MQVQRQLIKGAIIDLDGTLLDSMPIWTKVGELYLRQKGIEAREDLERTVKALSLQQAAAYLQEAYQLSDTTEQITRDINRLIEDAYRYSLPLKAGAREFLLAFQQNQVPICIATATERYLAEAALERTGVLSYFAGIHTCTEIGAGKDCPLIYEIACHAMGTAKSETFVFEDALHAIETAKNAGFPVVAVYDAAAGADRRAICCLADRYLRSLEEWRLPNNV